MGSAQKSRLRVLRTYEGPAEERGMAGLIMLVRVYGRMNAAVAEQVKPFGLSMPHFEVLLSLKGGEGISQQELSDRLLVTKGNTCVMVQKMEAEGLLVRRTDPADQRVQRLYMTDAGRQLLAKILPGHFVQMRQMLAGLTGEQQKLLHELMSRIDQNLDGMLE